MFAVLEDRDAELTQGGAALGGGRRPDGAGGRGAGGAHGASDEEIERLVAERTQAKKTRNFARADAIRAELLAKGVVIEDGKDGVRWKRK